MNHLIILQKIQEMYRIFVLVFLGIVQMSCHTQDWPDWRGENRDGVWETSGVLQKFDSKVLD